VYIPFWLMNKYCILCNCNQSLFLLSYSTTSMFHVLGGWQKTDMQITELPWSLTNLVVTCFRIVRFWQTIKSKSIGLVKGWSNNCDR
jgi:hypothetical protein